ncbi:hypothetical protein JHK85_053296 [Glycine max]|nr:hypothetical protein JHK85_053296 [Glycine max]
MVGYFGIPVRDVDKNNNVDIVVTVVEGVDAVNPEIVFATRRSSPRRLILLMMVVGSRRPEIIVVAENFLYCFGMLMEFVEFVKLRRKFPYAERPYKVLVRKTGAILIGIHGHDDLYEALFPYNRAKGTLYDGET